MLKKILLLCFFLVVAACSKLEKQESFKELTYDYFASYDQKFKKCSADNLKDENTTCGNLFRIMRGTSTGGLSRCLDRKNKTVDRACVDAFAANKGYE